MHGVGSDWVGSCSWLVRVDTPTSLTLPSLSSLFQPDVCLLCCFVVFFCLSSCASFFFIYVTLSGLDKRRGYVLSVFVICCCNQPVRFSVSAAVEKRARDEALRVKCFAAGFLVLRLRSLTVHTFFDVPPPPRLFRPPLHSALSLSLNNNHHSADGRLSFRGSDGGERRHACGSAATEARWEQQP